MKLITIVGARPQFIKLGALNWEFSKHPNISNIVVHTGQHYDDQMTTIFFDQMNIPKPDYNLNINRLGHGAMTGRMIEKIEEIFLKEIPDLVILFGDTNSTLAGSIAASKLNIPIAHVEAGLRSFNNKMPEEINRIVTDRLSNLLFCPTKTSYENLVNESFKNFNDKHIFFVGDVMEDAIKIYSDYSLELPFNLSDNYILVTAHRQENLSDPKKIISIFKALDKISLTHEVVLPLHPHTQKILNEQKIDTSNIKIIEPLGYLHMLSLIKNSKMILTDSGGLQKEAFMLDKFCLTLRGETEWIELVDNGFNALVGHKHEKILKNFYSFIDKKYPNKPNLYGEGKASGKIVKYITDYLC